MFITSYIACPLKAFPASLIFVGKAGAYPTVKPFRLSTIG